jgi:hypothetical protein
MSFSASRRLSALAWSRASLISALPQFSIQMRRWCLRTFQYQPERRHHQPIRLEGAEQVFADVRRGGRRALPTGRSFVLLPYGVSGSAFSSCMTAACRFAPSDPRACQPAITSQCGDKQFHSFVDALQAGSVELFALALITVPGTMRKLLYLSVCVCLTGAAAWRGSGATAPMPNPDDGSVTQGIFTNTYFNLSYSLPSGWNEGTAAPAPPCTATTYSRH